MERDREREREREKEREKELLCLCMVIPLISTSQEGGGCWDPSFCGSPPG